MLIIGNLQYLQCVFRVRSSILGWNFGSVFSFLNHIQSLKKQRTTGIPSYQSSFHVQFTNIKLKLSFLKTELNTKILHLNIRNDFCHDFGFVFN